MTQWSLLSDGAAYQVDMHDADGLWLDLADLQSALGWQAKDNTLCSGDRCLPLSLHPGLVREGRVDLRAFAALQAMPLVTAPRVAAIAPAPEEKMDFLRGAEAPDFALPDLDGRRDPGQPGLDARR